MVLNEHPHDLCIDRNGLLAKVDWRCVRWLVLVDGVPRVVTDVLDAESLGRIRVQNVIDQVLSMLR